jgi:hypothetical protein
MSSPDTDPNLHRPISDLRWRPSCPPRAGGACHDVGSGNEAQRDRVLTQPVCDQDFLDAVLFAIRQDSRSATRSNRSPSLRACFAR